MTRQTSAVRPPLIAAWLVDLVAPREQTESILGDLLEEFSDLAAKSGLDSARRWYWQQSVKTIAHLAGAGLRTAPWTIAGAVVIGFLLLRFGSGLPEQVIVGVLHLRRHHVTPYYTWPQAQTYLLWLNSGIWIGHLLLSLFIGCFVAVIARGGEMVAATALGLLCGAMNGVGFLVLVARHSPENAYLAAFLVHQFASLIMIAIGGVIVRESRSALARRTARAR
jgi:hypothetical protein